MSVESHRDVNNISHKVDIGSIVYNVYMHHRDLWIDITLRLCVTRTRNSTLVPNCSLFLARFLGAISMSPVIFLPYNHEFLENQMYCF